ncbi:MULTISPECIES: MBL fold metallo-hydrolase [Methylobacterium]|uniref:Beta-lactamase n=2 Tax=Methylobacterium TaxID=407 RepID=A0A0C6FSD4_9HYPH|nr:MBL fold metallo-hydrolase [Methylobacterium aquaticum]BAQ49977.1 beta-lactamase [Methylobacterium aquaticum]
MRFRVGAATVTPIVEMVDRSFDMLRFFPLATGADIAANLAWMAPHHFDPRTRRLLLSMHSWLVEVGGRRILVDGCVGNGKQRDARPEWCNLSTAFLDRLAAAGAAPEAIDVVLCTHLHADHVGWNTRLLDGAWVPTFPNATYVFGRREHAHWQAEHERGAGGPHLQAYRDSVLPIIEAGRALIVDETHVLEGVLHLEPAPGHTPGHVAVWLRCGSETAAFTGDVLHHPVQVLHPDWSCMGCLDPARAARTRRRVLAEVARTEGILFPGHFMAPHAVRIAEDERGFAFRFLCEDAGPV